MKKKLIALDMDGTIIKNGKEFSPKSIEILSKLVNEGHEIVFATGRPIRSIVPYYEAIGCESYITAYNGLWVHRLNEFGKKPGFAFKKEIIQKIFERLKNDVLSFEAESEKKIYSLAKDDYLDLFFPYKGMQEIIGKDLCFEEDLLTVIILPKEGKEELVSKVVTSYEGYGYRPWTACRYGEMYRIGFNKGSALKYVQETLKIGKEDTIAIGDSDNDFEMLKEAGKAFAMKSSKSKLILDHFPTTDFGLEDDGASLLLEKILLKD